MSELVRPNCAGALTPRAIVEELDRYIVGQRAAKRAVAIALRNRWRRLQVPEHLRDEIAPKNIIMIGPTGVGKTEIARRLAKLSAAPFLKVEASKFTEVGYVGRDVDSIVRDLAEVAIKLVKDEEQIKVKARAREGAEERLLDLLFPPARPSDARAEDSTSGTRERLRALLREGKLDDREVEVETADDTTAMMNVFSGQGLEEMMVNLRDMMPGMRKTKKRRAKVPEALSILVDQEAGKLIDMDKVVREAVLRAENAGIVFIDEIDKVAGGRGGQGPDVSREGVQRDLLPIVEGSTVTTKYGPVRTDHVLFIAAGAFHVSKPSDLIPEMQGRFPIRVELEALAEGDFVRILSEPENSLVRQYTELLATEGVGVQFSAGAIAEIARIAALVNARAENIGARRLHTVMERLLDELSFTAPEIRGQQVTISEEYVRQRLDDVVKDEDLSRYIL